MSIGTENVRKQVHKLADGYACIVLKSICPGNSRHGDEYDKTGR